MRICLKLGAGLFSCFCVSCLCHIWLREDAMKATINAVRAWTHLSAILNFFLIAQKLEDWLFQSASRGPTWLRAVSAGITRLKISRYVCWHYTGIPRNENILTKHSKRFLFSCQFILSPLNTVFKFFGILYLVYCSDSLVYMLFFPEILAGLISHFKRSICPSESERNYFSSVSKVWDDITLKKTLDFLCNLTRTSCNVVSWADITEGNRCVPLIIQ